MQNCNQRTMGVDFRSVKLKAKQRLKRLREFQMLFSWGVAFFLGMAVGLPATHILKPITAILALTFLWLAYRFGSYIGQLKCTLHDLKYSQQRTLLKSDLKQLRQLVHSGLIHILWR